MFNYNFLYGNNYGYGCCCVSRPNPFMLGAIQGYTSAMQYFAMMNGNFFQPRQYVHPVFMQLQAFSNLLNTGNIWNSNAESDDQNNSRELGGIEDLRKIDVAIKFKTAQKQIEHAIPKYTFTRDTAKVSADLAKNNCEENPDKVSEQVSNNNKINSPSTTVSEKGKALLNNPEFMTRAKQVADSVNCSLNDLLAVMNAESGIDASAGKSAVGLIQFTDVALKELKRHGCIVSKSELRTMNPVKQLDYVEKYLKICKSYKFSKDARLSAEDLYAVVYLPGRANKENLAYKNDWYYKGNSGMDIDKNGIITKTELAKRVDKFNVSLIA